MIVQILQLWKAYLSERRMEVRGLPVDHVRVQAMNNTYERALVMMHKMPRVWLDYLEYLMQQYLLTRTRRAFDRALCSLPITQHDRVWQLYLVRPSELNLSYNHCPCFQRPLLDSSLLSCSVWSQFYLYKLQVLLAPVC